MVHCKIRNYLISEYSFERHCSDFGDKVHVKPTFSKKNLWGEDNSLFSNNRLLFLLSLLLFLGKFKGANLRGANTVEGWIELVTEGLLLLPLPSLWGKSLSMK